MKTPGGDALKKAQYRRCGLIPKACERCGSTGAPPQAAVSGTISPSPSARPVAREKLEARILADERIGAPEIRAARRAHAQRRPNHPPRRMAV
jgi:hypothetical protein